MNKRNFETIRLSQGEMHIYDFGAVKLHAYQTGDPLADEVFLMEKAGRFVVLESPCFTSSAAALSQYLEGTARAPPSCPRSPNTPPPTLWTTPSTAGERR